MKSLLIAGALLATTSLSAYAAPYTLFIYESAEQLALRPAADAASAAYWEAYDRFGKELAAAGVLRGGSALTTGAPVALVETGAERPAAPANSGSDLLLGGYFQIDVASDADAVAWANKMPAVGGVVEVRAGYPVPGMNM